MPIKVKLGTRILPWEDLLVPDQPSPFLDLGPDQDVEMVLAVLAGMGPTVPKMVQLDASGRQIVVTPSGGAQVQIMDATAAGGEKVASFSDSSTFAGVATLWNTSQLALFNGASNNHSMRDASSAVMNNRAGLGAILTTPPGMWAAVSTPAAGVVASATQAAAGAGIRHICAGIIVTFGAIAAPVATALTWVLRDGLTGVGTILAAGQIAVQAAAFQGQPVYLSDLSIPGTAATAMTLEFSAALANLLEGVTLLGWDAQ